MSTLEINIDHIATLRQARGGKDPDPLAAAVLAELAGVSGITAQLRHDRRHLQDRDIYLLKQVVTSRFNLQIAPTAEMLQLAADVRPSMVTLIRELHDEKTPEGGVQVAGKEKDFAKIIESLRESTIEPCLFIDPEVQQIRAAHKCGAKHIELHTGYYANAKGEQARIEELARLEDACIAAAKFELHVRAGTGLTFENVRSVSRIRRIETVIVGHALVARAALIGVDTAVRDFLKYL